MSAEYSADAGVAAAPPKRRHRRYKRDVRAVADIDGRTRASKLARGLAARLQAALPAPATAGQLELIQGCVLLSVLIGDAGVKVLHGQPVDPHALTALINCERRALDALGALQPDPKTIDGHASGGGDPELARRLANTWPEFHEQEIHQYNAEREAKRENPIEAALAKISELGDDDPVTQETIGAAVDREPPVKEEPQP